MKEEKIRFQGTHVSERIVSNANISLEHIEDAARKIERDRFGNRVFVSAHQTYTNRENIETRSALLLSPAGEEFIHHHPKILRKISRGLFFLTESESDRHSKKEIELGDEYRMRYFATGGQSQVFTLHTPQEKYIVKVHRSESDVHQAYSNEMLQIQSFATDRCDELRAMNIEFPQLLFASGQVMCAEYIPNTARFTPDFLRTYYALATTAQDYIAAQKRGEGAALWKSIFPDVIHRNALPTKNFRQRDNGTAVWVDPFFYCPREHPRRAHISLTDEEIATLQPLSVYEMQRVYEEVSRIIHTKDPEAEPRTLAEQKAILKAHNIRWVL